MNSFDWKTALREWSRKRIETLEDIDKLQLSPDIIESGYFGRPGATEEQIASAENRLSVILPPSYRKFLKASNGVRPTPDLGIEFYSTEEIDWYASGEEDWIKSLIEIMQDNPVPDEDYFVYGDEQSCLVFRPEYIKDLLAISSEELGFVFALNPKVIFPDGEWEAWFCSFSTAWGIYRYRSFRDMMEKRVFHNPTFL